MSIDVNRIREDFPILKEECAECHGNSVPDAGLWR